MIMAYYEALMASPGHVPTSYSFEECMFATLAMQIFNGLLVAVIATSDLDFKNERGAALASGGIKRQIAFLELYDAEKTIDLALSRDTYPFKPETLKSVVGDEVTLP